ncbi:unnamed protein product, partial [Pylaiella littoralis]
GDGRNDAGHSGSKATDEGNCADRLPNKTARLFSRLSSPRSGQQGGGGGDGGGWAAGQKVWDPSPTSATTGYVTSSPAPDWRRLGLSSLGRTASFDEARQAVSKNGLNAEESAKPRRASAFVSHGSALPPVVTEVGRRVSALGPSTTQAPRQAPHYSDLLSAKTPSRSITSFNGHPGYSPPTLVGIRDPKIEGEGKGAVSRGDLKSPTDPPGDMPRWSNEPTPGGNSRLHGAAAAAGGGGGAGGTPGSRAACMFHLMPATAAYTAGQTLRSPRKTPTTTAAPSAQGGAGSSRRWSVLGQAQSGPADNTGSDEGGATLVPAWGAPGKEGNGDEDDEGARGSGNRPAATMVASVRGGGGGGNAGGGDARENVSSGRARGLIMAPPPLAGRLGSQPRRPSVVGPPDQDRGNAGANGYVAAWGATDEEDPAEEPTSRRGTGPADGGVAGRGMGARCAKALFGGGGGGGAGAGAGNVNEDGAPHKARGSGNRPAATMVASVRGGGGGGNAGGGD